MQGDSITKSPTCMAFIDNFLYVAVYQLAVWGEGLHVTARLQRESFAVRNGYVMKLKLAMAWEDTLPWFRDIAHIHT